MVLLVPASVRPFDAMNGMSSSLCPAMKDHDVLLATGLSSDRSADASRSGQSALPLAVSELIRRADSVKALPDLMAAHRLVTLIGPGGIGKTSLALDIVRGLFPNFQGDGWLIELASIADPALVFRNTSRTLRNVIARPPSRQYAQSAMVRA
jgi:hypothetical protein